MLKTYSLTKDTLLVSSESNIKNSSVVYVYGDEREYIESYEHKYDFKIGNILTFDDQVAYDTMIDQNDEKSLLVSFLFPEVHEGEHLDNLTTSVVFLVFKNKLIIFTKQKLKFIPELLSNMVLRDVNHFVEEVLLKIMQKDLYVMLNDLRGVKEKIDDLDSEISTSGSLRPTFGDLLTLQKYMIALSTTYKANHKALDFIKKNFTTIDDIDFSIKKIIDELYDTSDTMDRIILGYSQYLDNLEDMINNMISYQLNMIMKTLTEISIVLTIPAVIFGFWGINVHVPFEKSSYGVLAVLIISAILSLICWFLMRRKTYL
ncbi:MULTISPECIES: magnesium transporter CorA family protein [unclassified Lactococcus]|uniref:magnesium transporter CorA family protein n=1 Tax=unclassified Lactococcus TaxID=2643510 RepID=UPI001431260D|nr:MULTISPECIES: magnesium transporter CorA family protein [unclassified Lactococcus]KAF6605402.1 magnesium transporter CorA family protein [Lactococcus sp. EKM201L]KAF6610760.1 magnesium transporter CorA family protein [Lactococcus sp. EKM203L]KAF6639804.1 magnesium transporter CorA family protein [Lactococcus sp. EKM501L]KAF6640909.1 magnesium transporter CorA family protein [Lactococcus sp. EKM502L]KAF6650449.1 magnesium transporter CorA family protein [Lactococcus sp. EKM101L]